MMFNFSPKPFRIYLFFNYISYKTYSYYANYKRLL